MPIRRIYADISELLDGAEELVLNADATAGDSTITVQSILGVSTNDILFFRGPGNERAEIIATHASTSPSGDTITLVSTLVESHPAGTTIKIIRANQVRFYHSATEDDANSDDTNLSALAAASNIDPTTIRNFYDDTAQTAGFYYYRFEDSINSVNLLYSDPIPYGQIQVQFADNEVGYIIESVRRKMGREWSDRFNKQDAIDEINECLRYKRSELKHWSRHLTRNHVLGQTSRGVYTATSPTDIYSNNSNKSVLNVRLEGVGRDLIWKDEKEFDALMDVVKLTTIRTQPSTGQSTLEITNSYSFDDDGTVHVFTNNVDDQIDYTGVTRSATAGVLTGVSTSGDGAIDATHAVGVNVWQDHEEGEPRFWNQSNGTFRFWPLPNSTFINLNYLLDYWTIATVVDSESDVIDADQYDMVKYWLLAKARARLENNGKLDLNDPDWKLFLATLKKAIMQELGGRGQKFKWKPKLNQVAYVGRDRRFDYT